jgi:hypothetical protein
MRHYWSDSFRAKANLVGLKRQEMLTSLFDVSFETGRYDLAQNAVNQLKPAQDFAYFFRRSKMDHLNGDLDSSISAMLKEADLTEESVYLKRVALSNTADLYIHAGRMKESAFFTGNALPLVAPIFLPSWGSAGSHW